jgi:ribosomal protein S18
MFHLPKGLSIIKMLLYYENLLVLREKILPRRFYWIKSKRATYHTAIKTARVAGLLPFINQ